MAKKVLEKIEYVINLIWAIIFGIPSFATMCVIARIKAKNGTARTYHNIRYGDGSKVTLKNFVTKISVNLEAVELISDEGHIACVHGTHDGRYFVKDHYETSFLMSKHFTNNHDYILISCCNGLHSDFSIDGKTFVRENKSKYECFMIPTKKHLITWASKWIRIYCFLQTPRTWFDAYQTYKEEEK